MALVYLAANVNACGLSELLLIVIKVFDLVRLDRATSTSRMLNAAIAALSILSCVRLGIEASISIFVSMTSSADGDGGVFNSASVLSMSAAKASRGLPAKIGSSSGKLSRRFATILSYGQQECCLWENFLCLQAHVRFLFEKTLQASQTERHDYHHVENHQKFLLSVQ